LDQNITAFSLVSDCEGGDPSAAARTMVDDVDDEDMAKLGFVDLRRRHESRDQVRRQRFCLGS
jgi:hypothetical protein